MEFALFFPTKPKQKKTKSYGEREGVWDTFDRNEYSRIKKGHEPSYDYATLRSKSGASFRLVLQTRKETRVWIIK